MIDVRFRLARRPDPGQLVGWWRRLLTRAGRLLLEETAEIITEDATFARYLDIVERLLAAAGGDLWVGRHLPEMVGVEHTQQVSVRPPAGEGAKMFRMSLDVWRTTPGVGEFAAEADLDRLADELDQRAARRVPAGSVEWRIQQLVIRR